MLVKTIQSKQIKLHISAIFPQKQKFFLCGNSVGGAGFSYEASSQFFFSFSLVLIAHWPPEEFMLYIYGYRRSLSINLCSYSLHEDLCFLCLLHTDRGGDEPACVFTKQLAPQTTNGGFSEKSVGHENHKNANCGTAAQQQKPLLWQFGRRKGWAGSWIASVICFFIVFTMLFFFAKLEQFAASRTHPLQQKKKTSALLKLTQGKQFITANMMLSLDELQYYPCVQE